MDPSAAFNTMIDGDVDIDERIEAARNLRTWLDIGGFYPAGAVDVDRHIAEILSLDM